MGRDPGRSVFVLSAGVVQKHRVIAAAVARPDVRKLIRRDGRARSSAPEQLDALTLDVRGEDAFEAAREQIAVA